MVQSEADRFKELYDVEQHVMATDGGVLVEDPYPAFAAAARARRRSTRARCASSSVRPRWD